MQLSFISLFFILMFSFGCKTKIIQQDQDMNDKETLYEIKKVTKSNDEWKKELSPEVYHVAREKGTERAFTGKYYDSKTEGTYHCKCCDLPLFSSKDKFDSGTGWPSFSQAIKKNHITDIVDKSHGMIRTEVTCTQCDAHLGHVFNDGPRPTGLRYCINSIVLEKK